MGDARRTAIIILSLVGALFSGFLALRSLFGVVCTGGCSLLLGYPTCLYGFVMFSAIFAFSLLMDRRWAAITVRSVAAFGVLFSLWFALQELRPCVFCYWLGFPNCVYGFVMYAAILVLALWKR